MRRFPCRAPLQALVMPPFGLLQVKPYAANSTVGLVPLPPLANSTVGLVPFGLVQLQGTSVSLSFEMLL